MSPDIQNETLGLMAHDILRDLSEEIRRHWFSLMLDETTDISNLKQLVF